MNPVNPVAGDRSRAIGGDAGSVTAVGALVVLALTALSLVLVSGVTGLVQDRRATVAADLAALSAAAVVHRVGVDEACVLAGQVADANGADLVACSAVDGGQTSYGLPGEQGVQVRVSIAGAAATAAAGAAAPS